jgi:hypothetical protein
MLAIGFLVQIIAAVMGGFIGPGLGFAQFPRELADLDRGAKAESQRTIALAPERVCFVGKVNP